jgi:hypothetical protein
VDVEDQCIGGLHRLGLGGPLERPEGECWSEYCRYVLFGARQDAEHLSTGDVAKWHQRAHPAVPELPSDSLRNVSGARQEVVDSDWHRGLGGPLCVAVLASLCICCPVVDVLGGDPSGQREHMAVGGCGEVQAV